MNLQLLDASQVGEILQLSKEQVLRLARTKQIVSVKIGTSVRFTQEAVSSFIASKTVGAK